MKTATLKTVLLGPPATGKSTLLHRLTNPKDSQTPLLPSTIGAAFSTIKLTLDSAHELTLEIWDTAGQERYRSLAPMYYRNAAIAVVVFDLSDETTLEGALRWIQEVKVQCQDIRIVVVGNKLDLGSSVEDETIWEAFAPEGLSNEIVKCSAVSGEGVQDVIEAIGAVVSEDAWIDKQDSSGVDLGSAGKVGCAC